VILEGPAANTQDAARRCRFDTDVVQRRHACRHFDR
jgi:hypothetical protein